MPANFMRHYYDIYQLLDHLLVQEFIGTEAYHAHKTKRFRRGDNPILSENEAFLLGDPATRAEYKSAYEASRALYYREQPDFEEILKRISQHSDLL